MDKDTVLMIWDNVAHTYEEDHDVLMMAAGMDPRMGSDGIAVDEDGCALILNRCGEFAYLPERYEPLYAFRMLKE